MIITIITVVLALSFLIFIHELGHFLAAKKVGVHVIEFSIGFPPKVFSKVVGKTEYLLSLIPIGGYVRLKGQSIDDEDPDDPENYAAKSVFQRFAILVAGPLMNLLVALVFMPLVFYIGYSIPSYLHDPPVIGIVTNGSIVESLDIQENDLILEVNDHRVSTWKEVETKLVESNEPVISLKLLRGTTVNFRSLDRETLRNQADLGLNPKVVPIVGQVSHGSSAESAGLKTGDRVLNIGGTKITEWSQISPLVQESEGKMLSLRIDRNKQEMVILVSPTWNNSGNYWVLGIGSKTIHVSENLENAIILGTKRVYFLGSRTFEFLFRLITGQEDGKSVGGPIMIAKMMGQAVQTSLSSLLTLVAFISLQFAIFNLLPIPALDGGHILFLIIEKISGRSLSKNLRMSIQRVGFSLLMILILYISIQDGIRLFGS